MKTMQRSHAARLRSQLLSLGPRKINKTLRSPSLGDLQETLAPHDQLTWSHVRGRCSLEHAAQDQGGSSSHSGAPHQSGAPTPGPVSGLINARVVHVRVDDLAHPINRESVLQKVAANYAKIGVSVDIQFGSFIEEDFRGRRDNIQITILSSSLDAADESLIRDAFVSQGWKSPDTEVASTIDVLRAHNAGFAAGSSTDPLAKLIFIKEMDATTRNTLGRAFALMYANDPDAAAEALDVYFYADTIIHELGHNFGLQHTSDTRNYMYAPPQGQLQYDLLNDIMGRPGAIRLKDNPSAWGQWVKTELANSERSFSQDQIAKISETLEKFLPSAPGTGGRGS